MSEVRGYRVFGRVQGVGFRWWASRIANDLGLAGYVRNVTDGSVEVHAVGDGAALDRLADALREGPRSARVARIEAIEADPDLPRAGFTIGADSRGSDR